jgi:hypothetical protein
VDADAELERFRRRRIWEHKRHADTAAAADD